MVVDLQGVVHGKERPHAPLKKIHAPLLREAQVVKTKKSSHWRSLIGRPDGRGQLDDGVIGPRIQ
eukprot:3944120-Pyramimonas_sp.AAC.1